VQQGNDRSREHVWLPWNCPPSANRGSSAMHEIIYLVGLVVVVMFILGALGLR
jgi:hypothetical protein